MKTHHLSLLRLILPFTIMVLAVFLWMGGVLSHPGGEGGWLYHYQSLVSGTLALLAGCFALVSTHMALTAEDRAKHAKAEIYWNRYKLDLEIFADFITDDMMFEDQCIPDASRNADDAQKRCREFFGSFSDAFPRKLFDISEIQYLTPDKRTLMHAIYALFWRIEAIMARKFWRDKYGEREACLEAVEELVKLITLMERHITMPEGALEVALSFQKSVQGEIEA